MCNRYSTPEELSEVAIELKDWVGPIRFRIPEGFQRRFNMGPMKTAPVILRRPDETTGGLMRWGLVPTWAKDDKLAYSTFNARSDGIDTKPTFRSAFKSRRCLVPADGFYEFKATGPAGKVKLPHRFVMKSGKPFVLAGLWESWRAKDAAESDESLHTFTIVTTEPNELCAQVHDRMPVILEGEDCATWLDPDNKDKETLLGLLKPYPADKMQVFELSTYVNKVTNEGPQCIEPVT